MEGKDIEKVQEEKDLGVIIDAELKFHLQCSVVVNTTVKSNFLCITPEMFTALYKTLVRTSLVRLILGCGNLIWGPCYVTDMYKLENVQRKTTRMVQSLRHVECTGRLKALKLPTLQYQQYTGDMMALYNILRGRYTISTFLTFTISTKPEVMLSNFLRII